MKEDARSLSVAEQREKRRIALRMKDLGYKSDEISRVVGVHKRTVDYWESQSKAKGRETAIEGGHRGSKYGDNRTLSALQEYRLQQLMLKKMPNELGLTNALWTRGSVRQLIERECKVVMPIRTVGEYLKRWGFTPQKPLKRAYEQNCEQVERWLKETYPEISRRAKVEGGEIHWGDETGIRSDSQHGRSYAPAGQTPVQQISGKRFSLNMISTLTNQGKVRYMLYEETMTREVLLRFLGRLIQDAGRKIFLILDNLRVHHSKDVRAWLDKRKDQIEVFYLPAYSPELNPDEYLNCDLKAQVHSAASAQNQKALKTKVRSSMKCLQISPDRTQKYFKHPNIAYAA